LTLAALARGDKVAAIARDVSTLDDVVASYGDQVLPITLDVTDRAAAFEAVAHAHGHVGRLDVVVNNDGCGQFGATGAQWTSGPSECSAGVGGGCFRDPPQRNDR
jgi:NADP-dependent 3-hydroxy acid dehydrogenase YdfG